MLAPRPPIRVRQRHRVALRAMRRPLLIKPGSLLVFPAAHELEVMGVDTTRQPARVVRLVAGRDPSAIVDLPHDLVRDLITSIP